MNKAPRYMKEYASSIKKYGWTVYLLKALDAKGRELVNQAIEKKNHDYMESYIQFAGKYPDNKDLRIIQSGTIQRINTEH